MTYVSQHRIEEEVSGELFTYKHIKSDGGLPLHDWHLWPCLSLPPCYPTPISSSTWTSSSSTTSPWTPSSSNDPPSSLDSCWLCSSRQVGSIGVCFPWLRLLAIKSRPTSSPLLWYLLCCSCVFIGTFSLIMAFTITQIVSHFYIMLRNFPGFLVVSWGSFLLFFLGILGPILMGGGFICNFNLGQCLSPSHGGMEPA